MPLGKYFWFRETEIDGIPVAVARSGWSKQGGFEIYLMDGAKGTALWNIVKEAGQPHGIGPGNPNWCERVESGLVSYGGDSDGQTNPFEVRMLQIRYRGQAELEICSNCSDSTCLDLS